MPRPVAILSALFLGFAALAATGCGSAYYRIGTPATPSMAQLPTHPARLTRPRPARQLAAAAYMPTGPATLRYARRLDGLSVGQATLSFAAGELKLRLEGGAQTTAVELSGRMTSTPGEVKVDLAALPNVMTLQGFSLPEPLPYQGQNWASTGSGMAWNYGVVGRQRVAVPAGEYDCLILRGTSGASDEDGWHHATQTLYLAEGVGIVRLEKSATVSRAALTTQQELVEELVAVEGR